MALQSVIFLTQIHKTFSRIMRKHQTNPTEIHSKKYLTSTLQNSQGHQNMKVLRNCYSQEDPKEIMTLKRNVVSWDGIIDRKRTVGKK